jgi:O-antigen/teichoic acid export membrane protein
MSVRKSLAWSYGAHFLVFVVTFGSGVVVAHLLTPHEMGVYSVAMATAGALGILSAFGVANYLVRDEALEPDTIAVAFTVNAILNFLSAAALLAIAIIAAQFQSAQAVGRAIGLLAAVPLLSILEFLPAALLTREMRLDVTSTITLGKAAVNSAAVIGLAWAGWSYLSPVFAALLAGAFGAAGYSLVGRRYVGLRLSLKGWRSVAAFAVQMISAGGVSVLLARLSEIVLARILGLSALGLYTRASGLAAMIWDGVYGLATKVTFVQMAAEQRERGTLRITYLQATRLMTAILWPVVIGIAVLAPPLVRLLYGEKWLAAAFPLAMLMLVQFIGMSIAMNWELCVLTHRTGWQAKVELVRAVIGLVSFSIGALFSLVGASIGRVIEVIFGYLIYRPRMDEMAGAAAGDVSAIYRGSALLTLAAVGPSAALMAWTRWSANTPLVAIALAVVIGGILWLLALQRLQHPLFDEMRSAARWLFRSAATRTR